MLTEDIIEVKKNKTETLSYNEAEKKDTKKEPSKKERKARRDPKYQQMINKAVSKYGYIKDEDDAVRRWLQDTGFADHEHNKRQENEIKELKKAVKDLQDELHEFKRTLKTGDRPSSWRTRDNDPRKR